MLSALKYYPVIYRQNLDFSNMLSFASVSKDFYAEFIANDFITCMLLSFTGENLYQTL